MRTLQECQDHPRLGYLGRLGHEAHADLREKPADATCTGTKFPTRLIHRFAERLWLAIPQTRRSLSAEISSMIIF